MTEQRKRACCSGPPTQVTYIEIRGNRVGMVGLEQIFEQLYQAGRRGDEALADDLLEPARVYNYVAPGSDDAYRLGLLRAYRGYVRTKEGAKEQPVWRTHTRRK